MKVGFTKRGGREGVKEGGREIRNRRDNVNKKNYQIAKIQNDRNVGHFRSEMKKSTLWILLLFCCFSYPPASEASRGVY